MHKIKGYKISNSHFRLGSKTHIRDFIYAKRLFQHSFYAHRFSFIVAKYLKQYFINNPLNENESLTLLGYGEYSQMFINRLERLLKPLIKNINHNMVTDVEEPTLLIDEQLNDNIIIIVPISTTFSTSIKIENMIRKLIQEGRCNSKILEPYINLILVSHNDLNDYNFVQELNTYLDYKIGENIDNRFQPYKLFNWTNIDFDNKIINLKTNSISETIRSEKYFTCIPSEWFLMENCELCIPKDNLLNEIPLLETDKASVTPDLLLDLPRSFKNNSCTANKNIIINENAIYSGHIEYLGNHYLHYINPLYFFRENEDKIIEWAKERKNSMNLWPNLFKSKILLIAPSLHSNTYFVELVNRYIFEDSATIIHYEIQGDFIENYQKFFSDDINSSDYIFYIDDFIQTGKTFHLVNDFVKLCKKLNPHSISPNGCSGIFTLVNKSDYYSYSDILENLSNQPFLGVSNEEKYFAFYDIKIQSINIDNCPLCNEQKRYKHLAESSMLDTIRHYFLNKQVKLNTVNISDIKRIKTDWYKFHPLVDENKEVPWEVNNDYTFAQWEIFKSNSFPEKKYLKLLIQHELNNLLSSDEELRNKINKVDYDGTNLSLPINYIANKELFNEIRIKVFSSQSIKSFQNKLDNVGKEILKVLCGQLVIKVFTIYPFVNIKVVRQKVFSWVLMELEDTIKLIISNNSLNFKDFRYLKFLLRRATLLGSNYLIRKETLENLRLIFRIYTKKRKEGIENIRSKKITYFLKKLEEIEIDYDKINKAISFLHSEINYISTIAAKKKENSLPFILEEKKSKLEGLEIELKELKSKEQYIKQAINNISYKEASLSEFSYFYVALIKELTLNNDSKVLILEENIKMVNDVIDADLDIDFIFLIRLIHFENVSLIQQGLKIIVNDYLSELKSDNQNDNLLCFKNKFKEKELQLKMHNQIEVAFNDYRLISFKQFLGIKDFKVFSEDPGFVIYLHVLYLIASLQNEETNPCKIPLEDKTKALIQNIYRIVAYPHSTDILNETDNSLSYSLDGISLGGFFTIRFKGDKDENTNPEEIIIAQATTEHTKPTGPSLMKVEIDNEALSYFFLNGISSRSSIILNKLIDDDKTKILNEYPLKPWTILELKLMGDDKNKYWHSPRGKVFPVNNKLEDSFNNIYFNNLTGDIKYGFTENLNIKGEPKQMIFFRIADIFESKGEIKNIGQASICLFNEDEDFDINRVRLLLLLRTYILSFVKTHFDNDSLIAFIKEKIKLKEAEKLKHGYLYYLNGLYALAMGSESYIDKSDLEYISKLYLDLVKSGPVLYNMFAEIDYLKSRNEKIELEYWEKKEMPLVKFTTELLFNKFKKMYKMILGTTNFGNPIDIINKLKFKKDYVIDKNLSISFPETLIDIIFAELLINAKKNFPQKVNPELFFEIKITPENNFEISILNNFESMLPVKTLLRINKNSIKYNTNGLGLIKRITSLLSDKPAEVFQGYVEKYKKDLFQVTLTLKNIEHV